MTVLSLPELRALRLDAQLLRGSVPDDGTNARSGPAADPVDAVVTVVERLVALQGQDLPAVQRAIALRAGVGLEAVAAAFAGGRIVRGWPMRGTLFVTTPRDLATLGMHTRAQAVSGLARRREQLGLTSAIVDRAAAAGLARLALAPATRAELLETWREAGIDVNGQRGYHLIATLSQAGLWHWGALRDGREQELVASAGVIALGEGDGDASRAFVRILLGYLDGHGPAALADLAWWTKAPRTVLRRALADAGDQVVAVRLEAADGPELLARPAHLARLGEVATPAAEEVHLLPAFDEYYLGYADRSPIASPAVQAAIVPGGNGVFRPTVLSAGRVVGTWARGTRKADPPAVIDLLEPVPARTRRALDALPASASQVQEAERERSRR